MLYSFRKLLFSAKKSNFSQRFCSYQTQALLGRQSEPQDIRQTLQYNPSIKPQTIKQLFIKPNVFYEAALEDCKEHQLDLSNYLSLICTKASLFLSSDEIWNRRLILHALEQTIASDHQFIYMMGLKNSGKSKILQSFQRAHSDQVFYVDLRHHTNILEGLIAIVESHYQLINEEKEVKQNPLSLSHYPSPSSAVKSIVTSRYHYWRKKIFPTSISAAHTASAAVSAVTGGKVSNDHWQRFFLKVQQLNKPTSSTTTSPLSTSASEKKTQIALLHSYIEAMREEWGDVITIIIDEANNAFQFLSNSADCDSDRYLETKALFNYFIALTKQYGKVNIILCANDDFSFPYPYPFYSSQPSSDHTTFFYDVHYFTSYLFCDELIPCDAFHLLTDQWGMKEQLATAFIDYYGGNIHTLYHSFRTFQHSFQSFQPHQSSDIINVQRCLFHCQQHHSNHIEEVMEILRQLSERGVHPLLSQHYHYDSPAVVMLISHRIGNIVQRSNQTILEGVAASLWQREEMREVVFGLVPCSQAMRLSIAYCLPLPSTSYQNETMK